MELHHPIMSKLWDLGGRTKRKKNHCFLCKNALESVNKMFLIPVFEHYTLIDIYIALVNVIETIDHLFSMTG